jgi:hypothetical protein
MLVSQAGLFASFLEGCEGMYCGSPVEGRRAAFILLGSQPQRALVTSEFSFLSCNLSPVHGLGCILREYSQFLGPALSFPHHPTTEPLFMAVHHMGTLPQAEVSKATHLPTCSEIPATRKAEIGGRLKFEANPGKS